jgi:hypothetical protein
MLFQYRAAAARRRPRAAPVPAGREVAAGAVSGARGGGDIAPSRAISAPLANRDSSDPREQHRIGGFPPRNRGVGAIVHFLASVPLLGWDAWLTYS